jgi:hypothetical protein
LTATASKLQLVTGGAGMGDLSFTPLYEGGPKLRLGLIGKLTVAVALGLIFLVAHATAVNGQVRDDWSWLLAAIITTAMLALYYATDTLRGVLPLMSLRLRANDLERTTIGDDRDRAFMDPLRRWLSSGKIVLIGGAVGLVNAGVGFAFGIPSPWSCAFYTTLFGFFLAGFVCGMATLGILGVTIVIAHFATHAEKSFDYTAPDHCGGVQFIGEALVAFSSVTLIVGVMISVYIHAFPWTHKGPSVVLLQWLWIILPYALSLIVLVWPAVPLNDALRRYKLREEEKQLKESAAIKRKLSAEPPDGDIKGLREDYAFEQNVRKELHAMGTWPHGMSANLKYLGIFAANLLASASTVVSLLDKTHR